MVPRTEQRSLLVEEALRVLADEGAQAVQARSLTARVGMSTQAVYTLFGGMPGLVDAVVAEGFDRLAVHVRTVADTDDPVADHFLGGLMYCDWAFHHASLYRLMFGATAVGGSAHRPVLAAGSPDALPEARSAIAVLERSVQRMVDARRVVTPLATTTIARQFLSATHGFVLLELGGVFGHPASGEGLFTLGTLAVHLLIGLGDGREAVERSLAVATGRFGGGG